jgi:hypothetical protein
MSATTTPYAEDVTVEIEVATRSNWGLSARSCASRTSTTSKNGNCLHCNVYQKDKESNKLHVLPVQKLLMTLLQSFWWGSTARTYQSRKRPCWRAGDAVLGRGLPKFSQLARNLPFDFIFRHTPKSRDLLASYSDTNTVHESA